MTIDVPRRQPNRRRILVLATAAVIVVAVAVAAGVYYHVTRPPGDVLPFDGVDGAFFVAAGSAGDVYVTEDRNGGRVLKLAAGSSTPAELPFTGLHCGQSLCIPNGVAVDTAGSVYVAEYDKVVKLTAGATTPTIVPHIGGGMGVAVDTAGNVYVAATEGDVFKLAVGATEATRLPFTGLQSPWGVAVDTAGNVYVAGGHQVLKLAAGSSTPTVLPFTGLSSAFGVAVSAAGDVYVTDSDGDQVYKLAAGSSSATVLVRSLTGGRIIPSPLHNPRGVAVDPAGNVYITEPHAGVYKLSAR